MVNSTLPLLDEKNRFKLAVFAMNVSGGLSATSAEGRLQGGDWGEVRRLALAAEAAGFDALIPIARWKGYGGATQWNDRSFETFTWAAGLAAITERIQVFATVQVPTVHPVRAAKEAVTVDHISGGRFGLNVVAGWNVGELKMFGHTPRSKDERYEVADEFVTFMKRIWTEDIFDFEGRFFQSQAVHGAPQPLRKAGPLIMSAGGSESGSRFAAKQADIQFLNLQTLEGAAERVARLKQRARDDFGRDLKVMTCLYIICRETEQAARDYFDYVVKEKGDMAAARNMLEVLLPTHNFQVLPGMLEQVCAGFGGVGLVGTPAQVVDKFKELAEIGVDGAAVTWIDYDAGIRQYQDVLLPMLRAAGLRA